MSTETAYEEVEEVTATKTPKPRRGLVSLNEAIGILGDPEIVYVRVGGQYRVARESDTGHEYLSPSYSLRELVVWLAGFASGQNNS